MKIIPSPGLIASSELTIKEAIKIMGKNRSSYLLLKNGEGDISGIFTETDLVRIMGDYCEHPEIGERTVHQFMSSPVKTLSPELMHTAPEFMLRYNVSHVPIKDYDSKTKKPVIAGIITSKSLFEYVVRLRDLPPIFGGNLSRTHRKIIGVLSANGATFRTLTSIFSKSVYVNVERFQFSHFELERVAEKVDVLIMDLDDTENRHWLPISKDIVKHPNLETVFITYTESKHEDVEKFLKALETSALVRLYRKPLDISKLTTDLETLWVGS